MFKKVSFIISFFLTLNLYGQKYFSFIDTNSIWRDRHFDKFWEGLGIITYQWWDSQEWINGDTIFNYKYKKLYQTGYKYYHYFYQL